jgi:hypothetical protein
MQVNNTGLRAGDIIMAPSDFHFPKEVVNGREWELVKYEWREGRGRYLYVSRTDDEQREVWRDQPKYQVGA